MKTSRWWEDSNRSARGAEGTPRLGVSRARLAQAEGKGLVGGPFQAESGVIRRSLVREKHSY